MKKQERQCILDRPLNKKTEVSLSAMAFLFSELVQYNQTRVNSITDLEQRLANQLEEAGYGVGSRVLEILISREKANKREIRLQGMLQFIHTNVWRCLFGKPADSLEIVKEDEYIIGDKDLLVNRYISVPKDFGSLNCGVFVAGIVKGILDDAGFPSHVSAYYAPIEGQARPRTNILIKLAPEVLAREARMG